MGLFIVFEGIEGCGKTTQIKLFSDYLKANGIPCTLTREPGGTPIGEEIRRIFLRSEHRDMLPLTELCLVMAARVQHLEQVIKPALDAGWIVVCDRFYGATVAYQGYAGGVSREVIARSHELLCGGIQPDMTVLLDCPAAIGLGRSRSRNAAAGSQAAEGRFEEKALAFHERVRQGYCELAAAAPGRYIVINAEPPVGLVQDEVRARLMPLFRKHGYGV